MCADAGNFYLETPLDYPEYTRIPVELVPQEFIDANNLASKIKNGYLHENNARNLRFTTTRCFSQQATEKNDSKNMITTQSTTHQDFSHTRLAQYGLHL